MSDVEELSEVADQLAEAVIAIDAVDLNALLDDDVRAVLDCKDTLGAICQRCRRNQHAMETQGDRTADDTGGDR